MTNLADVFAAIELHSTRLRQYDNAHLSVLAGWEMGHGSADLLLAEDEAFDALLAACRALRETYGRYSEERVGTETAPLMGGDHAAQR